jgi:hypothetical protein
LLLVSGCAVLGRGERGGASSILAVRDQVYPLSLHLDRDSVEVDGVLYRVESRFVADSVLWIQTRVVASNRKPRVVSTTDGACQPVVRIYQEPRRNGAPVWDETRWLRPPTGCQRAGRGLTLEPGQERVVHAVAVAPLRLRAVLPPRRYYLTVVFWVGGQAYEVASGEGDVDRAGEVAGGR